MALFPRVTVWVSNQVLTASALNGEFDNILNNAMASSWIGFSANVSQMQQQTNPGGVGSESLAGSISDELQRLRFMFAYTLGTTYWYDQTGRNLGAGNLAVQPADLSDSAVLALSPSGIINAFGGAAAPSGWLLCDGTSYLRTAFPTLFTAIGTAYGAMDGTHFNVPDLRWQFLRGAGTAVGGNVFSVSGNNITITGHGFNRSGIPVQFTSGTPPAGLTANTLYYLIYVDDNTVQIATTPANAVAGTPITLTDTATGAGLVQWADPDEAARTASAFGANTGDNVGSAQQDAFQGHVVQAFNSTSGGFGSSFQPTAASTANSATFQNALLVTDGTNGIPRTGQETRPINVYVNYIIKT